MKVIETDGIVLKTMEFKEKDCILTFLTTKVGKKAGILHGGKSLRSGNAAKAELFVLNHFEFDSNQTWIWLESGNANCRKAFLLSVKIIQSFYTPVTFRNCCFNVKFLN